MKRLIVGMSGASGLPYGVRLLEVLREVPDIEVHLVMTEAAKLNVVVETDRKVHEVEALADVLHNVKNISATLASGSFKTDGMIVAPCSMRTLAAIVHSYADNLLVRAADVALKERRRLVVMPRETPLSIGHCKLLYEASLQGVMGVPADARVLHAPAHDRGPRGRCRRARARPLRHRSGHHQAVAGIPAQGADD